MISGYKSDCLKLKAFTLWELMIAMLITSLLVALSYGVYWRFTSVLNEEATQSEHMHQLRILERDLYRLTQICTDITREGDELVFSFPDEYTYLIFGDSTLIIEYPDETQKEIGIENWSASYLTKDSDYINHFQVRCMVGSGIFTLDFKKAYPQLFLYSLSKL